MKGSLTTHKRNKSGNKERNKFGIKQRKGNVETKQEIVRKQKTDLKKKPRNRLETNQKSKSRKRLKGNNNKQKNKLGYTSSFLSQSGPSWSFIFRAELDEKCIKIREFHGLSDTNAGQS